MLQNKFGKTGFANKYQLVIHRIAHECKFFFCQLWPAKCKYDGPRFVQDFNSRLSTLKDHLSANDVKKILLLSDNCLAHHKNKKHFKMLMKSTPNLIELVAYYWGHSRKTMKWWKKTFSWILEVTQVNAHILHVLSHPNERKKMTLSSFKDSIIENLLKLSNTDIPVG